jgi:hypothetical protein
MTTVNRAALLQAFESVSPGLAPKEVFQQSTCLVFKKGRVWTFNDEVACSYPSPLPDFEGALPAKPVTELLSKMTEDEIVVEVHPGEFRVRGKRRKAMVRMEDQVLLPIGGITPPGKWTSLPDDFCDAVNLIHTCATTDVSEYALSCIHIHPDYLEATDRHQISRYPCKTGLTEPTMVRASQLKEIVGVGVSEMSVADNWLHFRNSNGLVMSFRRDMGDYPDLSAFLDTAGATPFVLPAGLEDVVKCTSIFAKDSTQGDLVLVSLEPNRIIFEGSGAFGWYKEMKEVAYGGPSFQFLISPDLILAIADKANECSVAPGKLCITGAKFSYSTATNKLEDVSYQGAA